MKELRKLSATVFLTFAIGMSVAAGENQTPPCTSTEPGQIETPPCAAASRDVSEPTATSTISGDMGAPVTYKASFTNLAADILLNFLPLF